LKLHGCYFEIVRVVIILVRVIPLYPPSKGEENKIRL
jgi:hypothetical protein